MKIILISDYEGLGKAGELIDVKPGFARNKLLPNGFALRASRKNIALIEEKKKLLETSKMREDASLQELLKEISKTEITIEAQVGEEEKMFGSVTSNDIHKALEEKGRPCIFAPGFYPMIKDELVSKIKKDMTKKQRV